MEQHTDYLCSIFIFKGMDTERIKKLCSNITLEEKKYNRADIIFSPDGFDKKIGFITSGECLVSKPSSSGAPVPLNVLKKYDSFGVSTIFSNKESFPTQVSAKTSSSVLFISESDVLKLIRQDPEVSLNILKFMSDRINFLNDRVAAFSGGSVEEKLANYILELSRKHKSLEFEFNKKKSSEAINCGRASLYRAIEHFVLEGYITLVGKKIYINDLYGLERKTK